MQQLSVRLAVVAHDHDRRLDCNVQKVLSGRITVANRELFCNAEHLCCRLNVSRSRGRISVEGIEHAKAHAVEEELHNLGISAPCETYRSIASLAHHRLVLQHSLRPLSKAHDSLHIIAIVVCDRTVVSGNGKLGAAPATRTVVVRIYLTPPANVGEVARCLAAAL
eukprot:3923011-Prymnesium_polylepis.4